LHDLLEDPSKRTQENLKELKTIVDEHSESPKYVYEEEEGEVVYSPGDDSIYEVPVGEDGEALYANIPPLPKIKFKKTKKFPGFWGDEDKGLEGGDY
jgi:hypothetical protein